MTMSRSVGCHVIAAVLFGPAIEYQRPDSGDHLHTNDIGYAATANAIPLALLGVV